jgi:hypothetical protein
MHRAQDVLLAGAFDSARINEVLASLAAELAPAYPYLNATADAQPSGPVAAVLAHLSASFSHAAAGRSQCAVSSLVTASTSAYRLAGEAELDAAEAGDRGYWR